MFEYQGVGFGYQQADVNVYLERAVDGNGNPVQGNFQVYENVVQLSGNVTPDVSGPMGHGGSWFDNIGFGDVTPSSNYVNWEVQTFYYATSNGRQSPLTTVIWQFSNMVNGVLVTGVPIVIRP